MDSAFSSAFGQSVEAPFTHSGAPLKSTSSLHVPFSPDHPLRGPISPVSSSLQVRDCVPSPSEVHYPSPPPPPDQSIFTGSYSHGLSASAPTADLFLPPQLCINPAFLTPPSLPPPIHPHAHHANSTAIRTQSPESGSLQDLSESVALSAEDARVSPLVTQCAPDVPASEDSRELILTLTHLNLRRSRRVSTHASTRSSSNPYTPSPSSTTTTGASSPLPMSRSSSSAPTRTSGSNTTRRTYRPRNAQIIGAPPPVAPGTTQCPLCLLVLARPHDVGRHMRTHTGALPFCCGGLPLAEGAQAGPGVRWYGGAAYVGGCGMPFSRRDALQRHLGSVRNNGSWCVGNAYAPYQGKDDSDAQ